MTCDFFRLPDGTRGVICSRASKRATCATCGQVADLLCDGCDKPLCRDCAVSPRDNEDLCPKCFNAPFQAWLRAGALGHHVIPGHREQRRDAFRAFVREHPSFLDCVRRSPAGQRARGAR